VRYFAKHHSVHILPRCLDEEVAALAASNQSINLAQEILWNDDMGTQSILSHRFPYCVRVHMNVESIQARGRS